MPRAAFAATAGICLAASCTGGQAAPAFTEQVCSDAFQTSGARCGIVTVPENYENPAGRTIALKVIVLPAMKDDGVHDAHFELEGGPGYAVTDTAGFYLGPGAAYRERRDIVFTDMRGTGGSNPLRCPEIEALEQSDPWAPMYPPEMIAGCAGQLSLDADLSQYSTRYAARDLESVRIALGYEEVSLFGISYGTSLALAYMADYPDRVGAAVLIGTVSPESMPPRHHAGNAADALSALIASCESNAACVARYPSIEADLALAIEKLGSASDRRAIFLEWVRNRMYAPAEARRLPRLIELAAHGDVSAVAERSGPKRVFADGLYLSITCAESFPYFDLNQAIAEASETPFGDYRLRRQAAACAEWPVPPAELVVLAERMEPAVLFVSGEFDPVTPPAWAEQVMRFFPRSQHIVLPGSGHVFDGMEGVETCLDPLMLAFMDKRTLVESDLSCLPEVKPPPFAID